MQLGRLNTNEKRMMRSLLKTEGIRITKRWCVGKSKTHAHILVGKLIRKPLTVDRYLTFETISVPLKQPYDPIKDGPRTKELADGKNNR